MWPPVNHRYRAALLAAALLLCPACGDRSKLPAEVELHGFTMGASYVIRINEPQRQLDKVKLKQSINALLQDLNQTMSTYIDDSELMRLNNDQSGDWIPLSAPLYEVIEAAQHISQLSNGAFDITLGPAVNLWGFGKHRHERIPEQAQLDAARARTGYTLLELDKTNSSIRKGRVNMFIDLSAIAKGYAVDQLAALLEGWHIANYLVEIGGELRTKGRNASGVPWQIGIANPRGPDGAVESVIGLEDLALATSGDYRNFFEIDGQRYSHAIDPATAQPVSHQLVSVTVLHPSCMLADAFATAILIAGPEQGMQLAEREDLPALLIIVMGDALLKRSSTALKRLLKP